MTWNRSLRKNIRIVGVPESAGPVSFKFVSELLMEVLGMEKPPELDRAHRSLHPKPAPGERPRPIIVSFHRFQDKERAMCWVREKDQLLYQDKKIFFFNDSSANLAKKRAAFNGVKPSLYKKSVKSLMQHPAILRVVFEGKTINFDTPG